MEKTPMYAVMTPPHPCKKQWVAWAATGVSIIALVVACVTAAVAVRQVDRVTALENTVMDMQEHMEEILRFTLSSHDYLEYEEDLDESQLGPYEELTVQRVLRKKRQTNSVEDDTPQAPVPIYDQAYGINLQQGRSDSEGLRLYESLLATNGEGDPTSPKITVEATDSPIKPHHRDGVLDPTGSIVWPLKEISSMWVPKKRRDGYPSASGPNLSSRPYLHLDENASIEDTDAAALAANLVKSSGIRTPMTERRSRVKSTSGRSSTSTNGNSLTHHLVQSTVLQKVDQTPASSRRNSPAAYMDRRDNSVHNKDRKRTKRPKKRNSRRRRRGRSPITMAHFIAAPVNRTSHHGSEVHEEWSPAAWMDRLALNRKYTLNGGDVTVKEAGLYYVYAQVLYEPGRFSTGFQILVDDNPIMECTLAPANQPSHSCHTGGATYLPMNARVAVQDLERLSKAVQRQENSFFGMIKLMD